MHEDLKAARLARHEPNRPHRSPVGRKSQGGISAARNATVSPATTSASAYLTIDDEAAVFCLERAEREFGKRNPSDDG